MRHAIFVVSAQTRAEANSLSAAMGWGPANYTIRLSNRSDGAVSHYALATPVSEQFVAFYKAAMAGTPPPGIPASLIAIVPLLTIDFDPALPTAEEPNPPRLYADDAAHFSAVIERLGMRVA